MNSAFPGDAAAALGIAPEIIRLHALAWQPGAAMHAQWWVHLGLADWQHDYLSRAACRRALDAAIVRRRGFPVKPLPAALTEMQHRIVALEPRLVQLSVALGLIAMNCPTYLLLGEYRRALAPVLGAHACEQLIALPALDTPSCDGVPAQEVVEHAGETGRRWLDASLGECPVWRALSIKLPPPVPASRIALPEICALPSFFKLERFL